MSQLCIKCSKHADCPSHVYKPVPSFNVALSALLSHHGMSHAAPISVQHAHTFAASQQHRSSTGMSCAVLGGSWRWCGTRVMWCTWTMQWLCLQQVASTRVWPIISMRYTLEYMQTVHTLPCKHSFQDKAWAPVVRLCSMWYVVTEYM